MVLGGVLESKLAELKQFWEMITFRVKSSQWLVKWRGSGGHL